MSYNQSLKSNSNYPPMTQSQWDSAPFNEPVDKEVEVTVSVTLSKTVTVTIPYNVEDLSMLDLQDLVREQYDLPQDKCVDWYVDDFEVAL